MWRGHEGLQFRWTEGSQFEAQPKKKREEKEKKNEREREGEKHEVITELKTKARRALV